MKIRKYFAADMRQALNMAREEQGEDVVILSNRKVIGGVELVAAEDYDEQLFKQRGRPDGDISAAREENAGAAPGDEIAGTAAEKPAATGPAAHSRQGAWSGEPALDEVRKEINSLRDLLEKQMSGLAWGEVGRQHPLWAGLLRKFGNMGLSAALARELVQQVPEHYQFEQAWRTALALLSYRIPVAKEPVLHRGRVLALLGASGSGKTTTLAKMATRWVLEHGPDSVVLATLDSYRVGGREQLRSYARILGIPLRSINKSSELKDLLDQFQDRKLVLIDTAGLSPGDAKHREQLSLLKPFRERLDPCLVYPAIAQIPALEQITDIYRPLSSAMCVVTKLDEASSIGGVLSIAVADQLSVIFQCDGQQVPEDMHRGDAAKLIARAVSMMNRHPASVEDELMEQHFGNHAVYNPIGENYEH